ncbi:MAG: hypothetical protein KC731_37120, partial [Myxococcales bacterium]|nr:hypothetical protein [Myxococcales bacterium]
GGADGEAGRPEARDLPEAERALQDAAEALERGLASAEACDEACAALRAMQRAADRICELEPGPRCESARARVAEARARLRDACPSCEPEGTTPRYEADVKEDEAPSPTSAPPAMERTGGCAACALGEAGDDGSLVFPWLGLGLALLLRRRRS